MTQTQYIEPAREYREAAERLAALVLEYYDCFFIPHADESEMVRLAEIVKAQPGTVPIERADFTVPGPSGEMKAVSFRVLQDTGADPVHPHFVPVKPEEGE